MGSGHYSTSTHAARKAAKQAAGKSTFDHSAYVTSSQPRSNWKTHDSLDPKRTNNDGPHKGEITRESYDNDDHPNSNAIAVVLDVTASNRAACEASHAK